MAVNLYGRMLAPFVLFLMFDPMLFWLAVSVVLAGIAFLIHFFITRDVRDHRERYAGEVRDAIKTKVPQKLTQALQDLGFQLVSADGQPMRFERSSINGREILERPGSKGRMRINLVRGLSEDIIDLEIIPASTAYIGVSLWAKKTEARILFDSLNEKLT